MLRESTVEHVLMIGGGRKQRVRCRVLLLLVSVVDGDWVILFDLDALELPEYRTNQLGWVPRELEMERGVAGESEAIDAVELFVMGWHA